jgi:predicted ribosome quality control (RQC) complex YloA/Tae2 family protein
MVFYFTLHADPSVLCYMGRDKYENEDLIRWGWPEDIWFHVDNHSSAHVYVRMPQGKGMNDLSPEMIEECCQLTKQNSIEGCKLNNVKIVFTPWSNLKKTNGMEVGQVSFHNESLRRYHTIAKKDTTILNRLEKTRVEKENVNFQDLREQRDTEERRKAKQQMVADQERKKKEAEEEQKALELKTYATLNDQSKMSTNQDYVPDEDDFM